MRWTAVAAYMDKLVEPLQPPDELSELGLALFSRYARLDSLHHQRPPASASAASRMNHDHVPTFSP